MFHGRRAAAQPELKTSGIHLWHSGACFILERLTARQDLCHFFTCSSDRLDEPWIANLIPNCASGDKPNIPPNVDSPIHSYRRANWKNANANRVNHIPQCFSLALDLLNAPLIKAQSNAEKRPERPHETTRSGARRAQAEGRVAPLRSTPSFVARHSTKAVLSRNVDRRRKPDGVFRILPIPSVTLQLVAKAHF